MTLPGAIERSFPDAVISERAERLHMLFQVPLTNFEKPFTGRGWSWMCSCACEFSHTLGKILPTLAGTFGELSNPQVKLCLPYKDKKLSSMLPHPVCSNSISQYQLQVQDVLWIWWFYVETARPVQKVAVFLRKSRQLQGGMGVAHGSTCWMVSDGVCCSGVLIRTRCAKHTSQKLKTEGACGSNW